MIFLLIVNVRNFLYVVQCKIIDKYLVLTLFEGPYAYVYMCFFHFYFIDLFFGNAFPHLSFSSTFFLPFVKWKWSTIVRGWDYYKSTWQMISWYTNELHMSVTRKDEKSCLDSECRWPVTEGLFSFYRIKILPILLENHNKYGKASSVP